MAAHPGVSIASSLPYQSSGLVITAVGVRHRYLTRRRRSGTTATRMAAAAGDGAGGEDGTSRRNSRGSSSSSSGGDGGDEDGDTGITTAPGSSETQLPRPPNDGGMQVCRVMAGARRRRVYGHAVAEMKITQGTEA